MSDRDTILAVLQSEISLAGLLLVFVGFLLSKAADLESEYGKWPKRLAAATAGAALINLALSYTCIRALQGSVFFAAHVLCGLEISLAITAAVGAAGFFASVK